MKNDSLTITEALGFLAIVLIAFLLSASWTIVQGRLKDYSDTVDSDRRIQTQFGLRKESRRKSNVIILLVGALIGLIIYLCL